MALVVLSIGCCVCVLCLCVLVMWMMSTARAERRELYDRLQSGTLRDYVMAETDRENAKESADNDSLNGDVSADLDYSIDDGGLDEQTIMDMQRLQEDFAAAMMAGDKAKETGDK